MNQSRGYSRNHHQYKKYKNFKQDNHQFHSNKGLFKSSMLEDPWETLIKKLVSEHQLHPDELLTNSSIIIQSQQNIVESHSEIIPHVTDCIFDSETNDDLETNSIPLKNETADSNAKLDESQDLKRRKQLALSLLS